MSAFNTTSMSFFYPVDPIFLDDDKFLVEDDFVEDS